MKNSKTILQEVIENIDLAESAEEIRSIAYFLVTRLFDITKTDILAGKIVPFPESAALAVKKSVARINQGEPVQYVLGEEHFFGRKFQVNSSVLIPRPETEGIIRVVRDYVLGLSADEVKPDRLRILDIGTGSGCIPVTLFHEIRSAQIFATDISNAALSVAVNNAQLHKAEITFIEHNILAEKIPVAEFDIIVSNPPYVTEREKNQMHSNVLNYEPHGALFVPDDDPLIFYKVILQQTTTALKESGLLAVEINPQYAKDVMALFVNGGFEEVAIAQDISGKERVVSGIKS